MADAVGCYADARDAISEWETQAVHAMDGFKIVLLDIEGVRLEGRRLTLYLQNEISENHCEIKHLKQLLTPPSPRLWKSGLFSSLCPYILQDAEYGNETSGSGEQAMVQVTWWAWFKSSIASTICCSSRAKASDTERMEAGLATTPLGPAFCQLSIGSQFVKTREKKCAARMKIFASELRTLANDGERVYTNEISALYAENEKLYTLNSTKVDEINDLKGKMALLDPEWEASYKFRSQGMNTTSPATTPVTADIVENT
ncbi:unnamed protein product, partial [Mesorhabditis spiculigera]